MRSLGAAIYGRDKREVMYVAHELECGMVSTNDFGASRGGNSRTRTFMLISN